MKCFQISDFLCARIHFLTHICQRDAAFIHHYQKMIENIVNLTYQFRFFAVFCSNNGFSTLFSHFFQDFIQAFLKQIAGIRTCLGLRAALATNPIFPAIATESRIRWAGLEPEDFEFYTTYENTGYCKPNPAYYQELLNRLGEDPECCLMVGNDVTEDMIARELGMQVFLLTDCLINRKEKDISVYPNGGFDELMNYVRTSV